MALGERSRDTLQELAENVDLERLAAHVQAALEEMPEYRAFVAGRGGEADRGPAGIRRNIEAFRRWAAGGGEPDREALREMIGARAAEGRAAEEGLAVYRRAIRAAWEAMLADATPEQKAVAGESFDLVLEWLEIVSEIFTETHAGADLRGLEERRAGELVARLSRGEEPGPDERALAELLGFRMGERFHCLAFRPGAASGELLEQRQALLRLATELRRTGLLAAAREEVGLVVALESVAAGGEPQESNRGAAPAAATAPSPPLPAAAAEFAKAAKSNLICTGPLVAAEAVGEGLADVTTTTELAAQAGRSGLVATDDFLIELILARSPSQSARLHALIFGPLLEAGRPELAETLATLAENGFERTATARALPVHRNTLAQRLARIESLTGLDLNRTEHRVRVWLATRATSHVHGAQSHP